MIDMNEKLYEALASFEREDGSLKQINDNGVHIANAIEDVFTEADFEAKDYDITSCVVFSSPAADFGYVSVAWIENGRLHHHTYEFE
jgi:hypothetical protein